MCLSNNIKTKYEISTIEDRNSKTNTHTHKQRRKTKQCNLGSDKIQYNNSFHSVLYYLCAESTATRPIADRAQFI
jgi:hypothetical protein